MWVLDYPRYAARAESIGSWLRYVDSCGTVSRSVMRRWRCWRCCSRSATIVICRSMPGVRTTRLNYVARPRHRLSEPEIRVDRASDDEVLALLGACRSARDRFIVIAMSRAGLRRGEVCGLRREDMHFVADASGLGCAVIGPHLHVRRRANANGAWAKSRRSRAVPVDDLVVLAYDTYVFERDRCRQARDCDFVLVNLFHPPLGAPMRPGAVNELLTGLSRRAGLSRSVHPHQLRHGFASNVLDAGGALDEAQELLGHARARLDTDLPASFPAEIARCRRSRRCVGAGGRRRPVSAVLAAVSDSRPERATEDPWSRLDAEFLTTAGWDPETETLAPPPDHPLLGFRCCRVQGCRCEAGPADGFCVTCRKAYQLSGMSVEEFATAGPVRQLRRGEVICAVRGCPRPCRNNSITLCQVHDNHRKRLNLSAAQFVNHPAAQPLPGFGVCRVPVCDRQARYLRGLCGTHYALWWDQDRKGLTTDFDAWCRSASPIASGHAVDHAWTDFCGAGRDSLWPAGTVSTRRDHLPLPAAHLHPPPARRGRCEHRRPRRRTAATAMSVGSLRSCRTR